MPARLGGVVAAEIRRLADFRDAVVERLAALVGKQRDQAVAALLDQIGGALQRRRALAPPASRPMPRSRRPPRQSARCCSSGSASATIPTTRLVGRRRHATLRAAARVARDQRDARPPTGRRIAATPRRQRRQIGAAAELDAARILALAEDVERAARSPAWRGDCAAGKARGRRHRAGFRSARPDR